MQRQQNNQKIKIIKLFNFLLFFWFSYYFLHSSPAMTGDGIITMCVHNDSLPQIFVSWTLAFCWGRCMYTVSINQRIKRIRIFDCFYVLNNYDVTHTSYLNEGQWKTDEDDMLFCQMAIIPFPVLCECCKV